MNNDNISKRSEYYIDRDCLNNYPHTIYTLIRLVYQVNEKQLYQFVFDIFKNDNNDTEKAILFDTGLFNTDRIRYMLELYLKDVLINTDNGKNANQVFNGIAKLIERLDDTQYLNFINNLFKDMNIDDIIGESIAYNDSLKKEYQTAITQNQPYYLKAQQFTSDDSIYKLKNNPDFCVMFLKTFLYTD